MSPPTNEGIPQCAESGYRSHRRWNQEVRSMPETTAAALAGDNRPNELTDARLRSVGNAPLQDAARGDGSPVTVDRSRRMLKKSSSAHTRARRARQARSARLEVQGSQFQKPRTQNSEPRTQNFKSRPSRAAIAPPYHVATLSFDLPSLTAFLTALNTCS